MLQDAPRQRRPPPSQRSDQPNWVNHLITNVCQTVQITVISVSAVGLVSIPVYLLAGKQTQAQVKVEISVIERFALGFMGAASIGGILYGRRQKTLRIRDVEQLHRALDDVQRRIDPSKGSSYL